jgi:DNA-binding IclR family transcriptional regulator
VRTAPIDNQFSAADAAATTVAVDRESLTAVEKACVLLSAFARHSDRVVGVSELARIAGLTKSTTFRQLCILERAAMVERSGRGYRIGRSLRALARGVMDSEHIKLAHALMPYLVEAFETTRQTVQLSVLDETDIIYLGTIRGHRTLPVPSNSGRRIPALRTASGKLLLAYRAVPPSIVTDPRPRSATVFLHTSTPSQAELAAIRRRGIAFDTGNTTEGTCCVAAPITANTGEALAAISICAPCGTNLNSIANVLERIAHAASVHLRQLTAASRG